MYGSTVTTNRTPIHHTLLRSDHIPERGRKRPCEVRERKKKKTVHLVEKTSAMAARGNPYRLEVSSYRPYAFLPNIGKQEDQPMPAPEAIPGCPAGLEYLTQIDQLLVNQQVELLECK